MPGSRTENQTNHMTTDTKIRIARYLAAAGIGSRRTCEQLVRDGKISVNGELINTPAFNVDPEHDRISYLDQLIKPAGLRYILLNKPPGYTCSRYDLHAEHLITELLPTDIRLFTVGRLDRDSEGLIICTNDGEFAQAVAHPRNEVPKTYLVTVTGNVTNDKLATMLRGIRDQDDILRAQTAGVEHQTERETILKIIITEGKNREIRRLCAHFNWRVNRLRRVAIGTLRDDSLAPGAWRDLNTEECRRLRDLTE